MKPAVMKPVGGGNRSSKSLKETLVGLRASKLESTAVTDPSAVTKYQRLIHSGISLSVTEFPQ
jgi:hypothetical protein